MKKKIGKRMTAAVSGALSLCVLLGSASSLAGCQKKLLDPKNPVPIEIWHYYNGPQQLQFDSMVTLFNDTEGMEKGIVVEAYSQGDVNELMQKILDSANKKVGAEEIPDVFAAYADTAYQIDQLGLVAKLDPYLIEKELEEFVPGYIEEGRFDAEGNLKIFPVAKSSEVLMLNQTDWDKFAGATGARVDALATYEGLTATAKAYYEWTDSLTPAPDDGKALFGRDAVANYFVVGMKQLGTDIFLVQDGKVTVNADEDKLRRLWDNLYVPFVNGWFAANGRFRSDDAKMGDIIALIGSTSGAAYFPTEVTLGDTESYPIQSMVLAPPVFEGADKCAVQQGAGMVVTKSTEAREYAATVFLKWFADAERNLTFSIGSGYLPVKKAANDSARLHSLLQENQSLEISEKLQDALVIGMDMTQSYHFYTTKAFSGGNQARSVLENSMMDKAREDAKSVQLAVDGGTPRVQAAAAYCTDENFEAWLSAFRTQLAEATA